MEHRRIGVGVPQVDLIHGEVQTRLLRLLKGEGDPHIVGVHAQQTRHQRTQMVVRAPFDGIVAERHTQQGEYLVTGASVARLVDTAAPEVRVRAPVELARHLGHALGLWHIDGKALHESGNGCRA